MKISITTPEAIALAIVLIFFVAMWCLIGYVAWRAMQERLRNRTPRNRPNDSDTDG